MRFALAVLAAFAFCSATLAADPMRTERSIDGPWEFRRDDRKEWKPITVPSAMQSHEGNDWHGIGRYRKQLGPVSVPEGQRMLVHVTAAATFTEVFWNGTKVGEHLGGWTPFRVEVTDMVRKAEPNAEHELTIKVDERVGHNTQGFLPIVQPHFGGLWQSVKLITLPADYIDDLKAITPANTDLPIWSPAEPKLKDVTVTNSAGDRVIVRTARRTIEVRGTQLLLNGRPLQVRGVLNWGYYPPTLEPNPSDDTWRADLRRIKARGFNLMKCCLWVPPTRLLDIADQEGVLIWMEYPTWHPQLTPKHLPDLTREFDEFFAHVRNHPCVVLHSLTCETGSSADISVLKELTARCKSMIAGAVVEDDSSWIEWNRVTDFYDDHPYGNNHTWVKTLHRLRDYKALGAKPLLLGEAIAADTWTPGDAFSPSAAKDRPYWWPWHSPANAEWLRKMREFGFEIDEQQLVKDAKRYAMLMRKHQIETFRREVPDGGYVVSVIRDFPLAAMGLVDYQGRDKWPADAWSWHGETMLALKLDLPSENSYSECQRCLVTNRLDGRVIPAGPVSKNANWTIVARIDDWIRAEPLVESSHDSITTSVPEASTPTRVAIKASLSDEGKQITANEWSVWAIPNGRQKPSGVIVARRMDEAILDQLVAGARLLLLPDNGPGSPPVQPHWFLRGGPVVFPHPALPGLHHDFFVETQHFDLSSGVIPNVSYLGEVDPILLLWDTHDIREVRTHALAYSTRVSAGRLLVSSLRHDGDNNPAGQWLQSEFMNYLATGPEPRKALSPETIAGIRRKLTEQKVELGGNQIWKFHPDPKDEGLAMGWHNPDFDSADWADIKIDRHWEAQGYPDLDGWAWYRLTVTVPPAFAEKDVYLKFTGVDDYYDLYVNGIKAGSGGDIPTKTTAFDEVKSHKITPLVKPGEPMTIAVRVYDWGGSGGIFRPVTLTTSAGDSKGASFVR
jgi:Glycosyl hydrolases family 2, sugar binding domain/Glycosyl hydrolases family 2, TIM barrel domain